jgi:cathepsin A (carboxypeptidase C)
MRLSTSALVLGAASSAVGFQDQKVLNNPKSTFGLDFNKVGDIDFDSWTKPLKEAYGEATSEAKAIWAEVSMLAPDAVDAFKKHLISAKPKKHSRIADSKWDHVVHGADVQKLWATNAKGESHRKVGGKIDNFKLRAKKVDPSKLGVDTVKQYSGYLDDNEKDKHLFYCKY